MRCGKYLFDADGIKVFTGTLLNEPNRDMGIHDENKKIGYYQSCPGGKVQFTRKHIEQYWERIESEPREKYARKPKRQN